MPRSRMVLVRRRRALRARNLMIAFIVACALLITGVGTEQLVVKGYPAFITRGPGIGATPDAPHK